jgi:hypothetical protein
MPDGFTDKELSKPAGKREIARIDKEWRALEIWQKTTDLAAVREKMKLPSKAAAQVLVNRAIERWQENSTIWADQEYVRQSMILRERISREIEKDNGGTVRDLVSLFERQSKLLGLDKQRDQAQVGVQFIVNTGIPEMPERPALPSKTMTDSEATIDGEVVE